MSNPVVRDILTRLAETVAEQAVARGACGDESKRFAHLMDQAEVLLDDAYAAGTMKSGLPEDAKKKAMDLELRAHDKGSEKHHDRKPPR